MKYILSGIFLFFCWFFSVLTIVQPLSKEVNSIKKELLITTKEKENLLKNLKIEKFINDSIINIHNKKLKYIDSLESQPLFYNCFNRPLTF